MKKSLIFLSIFIIAFIAFFDAKDRLNELDEVAANTPSQVEMKQMINNPTEQMKHDNIQNQQSIQSLKEKMKEDDENRVLQQNQLDNVDKRRDTVDNKIQ